MIQFIVEQGGWVHSTGPLQQSIAVNIVQSAHDHIFDSFGGGGWGEVFSYVNEAGWWG